MNHHQTNGVSLLETVARHEQTLIAEIAAAHDEARRIIEQAHADAASAAQQDASQLDMFVAGQRREAADTREQASIEIERKMQETVASIRARAAGGLDDAVKKVVQLVLPAQAGSAS
jgi:hypothetical protein